MNHIVIIGNGITGITTARYVRKLSDHKITVISAESKYFFSRTALMYIYMGHMTFEQIKPYEDGFWEKNKIDLFTARVEHIDTQQKQLQLEGKGTLSYDKLVIACGSKSNYFNWPGQDLDGVQGLYSLPDLEKMETATRGIKRAVIVGGGLIGIEMAEMLRTRGIDVTFLIRESRYWGNVLPKEEGALIGRHVEHHHVKLKLNTQLAEILADEDGRVRAVVTEKGEELACEFVGLTVGVSPHIGFVKSSGIQTGRGVLVNDFLETSVTDVYAAGDCAEILVEGDRNRIEQLWYTGRMQGEVLAKTLCGQRSAYHRGIWFNSAKLFDIEFHTYGFVAAEPRAGEESFYWEHPDGEKCLRLVYDGQSGVLLGMNAFGIRYRHRVFERWLREKRTLEYVLSHLNEANFDPEFFSRFEGDILAHFHKEPVSRRSRKKMFGLF